MMASGTGGSGGRMAIARMPAYRGATKLVVLGCVAGAVCAVLRATGDERDWSGVGQARRRLDAAMSERDQAERRLRAWRPAAVRHESPRSAGRAAAPSVTAARADTRVPPEPRTTQPSSAVSATPQHDGRLAHDTVWWLATAAHESGLRIGRLGPMPAEHGEPDAAEHGEPDAAGQRYDVAGTGGFGEVARWVRSLARVPATIVPLGIEVTRRAGGAAFSARFAVHDGDGRPAATSGLMRAALPAGAAEFGGSDALAMPRVAGILRDARGGLALIDAGGRARAAAVGERIGAERITRITADGVWLETDDGREQRVALSAEASR